MLCSKEETLDNSLLSDDSVETGISDESAREEVVLVRSVEVTARCHAGMLGAPGVEPITGDGNCFLHKTRFNIQLKAFLWE